MAKNAVAIVGTGYGLRVMYNCISKTKNFYVKSIYSRSHKGKLFSDKFNKIVYDKKLSLICLETPPFTHLKFLNKFKNLKCNILCEKPFLINKKEISFFEKNKKNFKFNLLVNYQLRYHPVLKLFKRKINDIGKIKKIKIVYNSNNFKEKKNDWWLNKKKGGGHLMAIGPHLLDLSNFLNGPIANIKKKLNMNTKFKKKIDTKFIINGKFKDSSDLEISSSCRYYKLKRNYFRISAHGSKGKIEFLNFDKILFKFKNKKVEYLSSKINTKDKFFENPWRVAQFYFFKEKKIKFSTKKDGYKELDPTIRNLKLLIKND